MAATTLRYHDYAMLLSCLDANWSRPKESQKHWETVKSALGRMRAQTETYASLVEKNLAAWKAANGLATAPSERICPKLFHTQGWLPFGHPDALTLSLVDDFDAAQAVIERYHGTTEEVTMAFCPVMAPHIADWERQHQGLECPFIEPSALFDDRPLPPADENLPFPEDLSPHAIQLQHPLLFFSRLRLTTMLTMGRALPVQDVVYRAINACIARTLTSLRAGQGSSVFGPGGPGKLRICFLDLQEEEEIGILFFCQDYSLAMTLLAGLKNLTVKDLHDTDPTMIDEVRKCRLYVETGEALKRLAPAGTAPDFWESLQVNHVFRWTRTTAAFGWHLVQDVMDQTVPSTPHPTPALNQVQGQLRVETAVGIMPGHMREVLDLLHQSPHHFSTGGTDFHLHSLGTEDLTLAWQAAPGPPAAPGAPASLVQTQHVIRTCAQLLQMLDSRRPSSSTQASPGTEPPRHVTEWSSRLSVPVPVLKDAQGEDILHPHVHANHQPGIIHRVLENLEQKPLPFLDFGKLRSETRRYGLPTSQRRSVLYLFENFGNILKHPHLSDVVLDFLDVIATFHGALTSGLANELAGQPDSPHHPHYTPRIGLDTVKEIAEMLDALDDSLELRLRRVYPEMPLRDWSLDFRSCLHQPLLSAEAVLKCALAILRKDVLGLNDASQSASGTAPPKRARESLGVVVHLNFGPGMKGRALKHLAREVAVPGGTTVRSRLAIFEADFPHLTLIPGFCDFYHEAFHLLYGELLDPGPERENADLSLQPGLVSPRLNKMDETPSPHPLEEEIFVQMLMLLMIFDGDGALLLRDHAWSYSNSAESALNSPPPENKTASTDPNADPNADPNEATKKAALKKLALNFFPPAIAVMVASHALQHTATGPDSQPPHIGDACRATRAQVEKPLTGLTFKEAADSFVQLLDQHRDLLADLDWLRPQTTGPVPASCPLRGWFGEWYARVQKHLERLWNAARTVYAAHVRRVVAEHSYDPAQAQDLSTHTYDQICSKYTQPEEFLPRTTAVQYKELLARLDEAIKSGWGDKEIGPQGIGYAPLFGMHLTPRSHKEGDCLDANIMIRRSLQRYLEIFRKQEPNTLYTLPREFHVITQDAMEQKPKAETGLVKFEPRTGKKYAEILIDQASAVQFSCIPAARRRHLGCQIGILKTAWDIASRNRARRFVTLLRQVEAPASSSSPASSP